MPFTILPIALLLAATCALINLWLGARIAAVRRREQVKVGDGGSEPLIRRMRAQANFAENAPLVAVLVGLIEFCAGTSTWLAIVAALFVVARLLHPFGMDGWQPGRTIGAVLTALLQLLLALWAIAIPIAAHHTAQRADRVVTVVPAG